MEKFSLIQEIYENELRSRNRGLEQYLVIYKKDFGKKTQQDFFYYIIPQWETSNKLYIDRFIHMGKKLVDSVFESELEKSIQSLRVLSDEYDSYIKNMLKMFKDLSLRFSNKEEDNAISPIFGFLRPMLYESSLKKEDKDMIKQLLLTNLQLTMKQITIFAEKISKKAVIDRYVKNIEDHFIRYGKIRMSEVEAIIVSDENIESKSGPYIQLRDFTRVTDENLNKIWCTVHDESFTLIGTVVLNQDSYLKIITKKVIETDPIKLIGYDWRNMETFT